MRGITRKTLSGTKSKACNLVHIALVVFYSAAAVYISMTEPVLALALSLTLLPQPDVNMTIGPPLHPVPAPHTPLKVAGIQSAVIEQLHPVAVERVARFFLTGRKGTSGEPSEARLVLSSIVAEGLATGGGC